MSDRWLLPRKVLAGARICALACAQLFVVASLAGCDDKAAAKQRVFQGILEQEEWEIAFEQPGRVESVRVKRGDMVQAGDVLAALDHQFAELAWRARRDEEAVVRAELSLLEAGARPEETASLMADARAVRAQEELARKMKARAEALHLNSSIGQAEVDRADSELARVSSQREAMDQRARAAKNGARPEELARARAKVESASTAVELEQARLARHSLRASARGQVVDIMVKPGEFASAGTPAVTIADLTQPYTEVFVPQAELAGIRLGQRSEVRVDAHAKAFEGRVEYISPKTEFTPRYLFSEEERPHLVVRVRVRIADPKGELNGGVPTFVSFHNLPARGLARLDR